MHNSDDVDRLILDEIDNAIVAKNDLAQVFVSKLGDNSPGVRLRFKLLDRINEAIDEMYDQRGDR